MPSNVKSPYASAFNSAINRGTPTWIAVQNIAKRNNKTETVVFNSLWKAGLCFRQKFNGQWCYWACNAGPSPAKNWKTSQFNMWQNFIDWCLACGWCTPEQLQKNAGSQQEFMSYCKKFFGKQFNGATPKTSTGPKTKKTTVGSKPKSKSKKHTVNKTKSYKFPTSKSRTARRYAA